MATFAAAISLLSTPLGAQWLNQPTPGIPRVADGKPDLAAPSPRTADGKPDFSGVWRISLPVGYLINLAADLEAADVQPWAAALFAERIAHFGKGDPGLGCLPLGPRYITGGGRVGIAKIIQTPAMIAVFFEDLAYRQVFMDGRSLPRDPFPSFMGYSVGRWEGDDLVVESVGFKDTMWLDYGGHPYSESLRITERYRRIDFGHVERQITIVDPKTFSKPISVEGAMVLAADTDLLESVCGETPLERFNFVERALDDRTVVVMPEVLANFVGVYDLEPGAPFGIQILKVSLSNGQLLMDINGKGRIPLVPISGTRFDSIPFAYEFVRDDHGAVTHLLVHRAEGTDKATRRRSTGP